MSLARIAGFGMVTALGMDWRTSCAAARAGLVRTEIAASFRMRSAVDGAVEPVIVHAAGLLTRGFEGEVRLTRLLKGALKDLLDQCIEPSSLASAVFYLSVPDPRRRFQGLDLVANDAVRAGIAEEAAEIETIEDDPKVIQHLLERAADLADWPATPRVRFSTNAGHAGGALAMQRALADLQSGVVETAVVGGVDSLLDEDTLQWLANTGRLKSDGNPAGVRPGEACAFVMLQRAGHSTPATLESLAYVEATAVTEEKRTLFGGHISVGMGLAEGVTRTAAAAGWTSPAAVWIVADHNGEVYRANEWGHLVARLRGQFPALESPMLWYPAASFGDTGSASGLIAIGQVVAGFARGYAPARTAMVLSSSEGSTRASVVMKAP